MKATRWFVSTFGGIIGLMGVEHGLGEILQGPVTAPGMSFPSWPESRFFAILAGEPAFSIVSNLFVTGLLACFFSITYVAWSIFFAGQKHSSTVMIIAAILMLLTGAGFFPPFFAIIIVFFTHRLQKPVSAWRPMTSPAVSLFSRLWLWMFGLCLAFWLAMFPGVPALDYFFGISSEGLIYAILVGMIVFLVLANLSGKARDLQAG